VSGTSVEGNMKRMMNASGESEREKIEKEKQGRLSELKRSFVFKTKQEKH
jgi:hypothetical protein